MPSPRPVPPLSRQDMIGSGLCIGCGSCVAGARTQGAAMDFDRDGQLKPVGPAAFLEKRSSGFSSLCPFSPHARNEDELAAALYPGAARTDPQAGRFDGAYVGHVAEADYRAAGSSGGLVSWVAAELLRLGLVDGVAHVAPTEDPARDGRYFRYRISRSPDAVRRGAKSRYYPIELSGVLETIRAVPGRYAIVGIPCFIKAVNLARLSDPLLGERIAFTLGLFCGHMKSARMVESFALQMGVAPEQVQAIDYRLKDPSRPANWYRAELKLKNGGSASQDWWHLVDGDWGSGFFQNSACDFCDDVIAETADISFGDAWVEPYASDGNGTNVVVVRSALLHGIVKDAVADGRLALEPVDAGFVVRTQAAGFRQRREGLAFRLARRRAGVRPRKRVQPCAGGLPLRRRLIYAMRRRISAWSPLVFRIARDLRRPGLFLTWGRTMLAIYHGVAYSRGWIGAAFDRLERLTGRSTQQG